jgi:hypothetical protein
MLEMALWHEYGAAALNFVADGKCSLELFLSILIEN